MGKQRIKRIADFLEKLAVGSVIIGIFQANGYGILLATLFLASSLLLTKEV